MENSTERRKKQKWLEYLQQDSWQLELIVSSLILLVAVTYDDYINRAGEELLSRSYGEINISDFLVIIPLFLLFIKSNLLIHMFCRAQWIGCIGLRYVAKDLRLSQLNYSWLFTRYLKKRTINFDKYIENLERISSVIFSFTFLMIFMFYHLHCISPQSYL